jgi:putative DNA primase/helicase
MPAEPRKKSKRTPKAAAVTAATVQTPAQRLDSCDVTAATVQAPARLDSCDEPSVSTDPALARMNQFFEEVRNGKFNREAANQPLTAEDLADIRGDQGVRNGKVRSHKFKAAKPEASAKPTSPSSIKSAAGDAPDLLHGFEHEDVGNAQRVVRMHGENLRFCHAMDKWLWWDGYRWCPDETDKALFLGQQTMVEFCSQAVRTPGAELAKFAVRSLQLSRILNALKLAQPQLAVLAQDLDTHPDLLNFRNGTLNLKTGELSPHERKHYITKLVHHDYSPESECPTFLSFLSRLMGSSPDVSEFDLERCDRLMRYLQIAFGYSLTGHTSEKSVFLLHGTGDNGKTTLLSTFLKLLEEYSVLLQIDSLMLRPQESNNTQADLADLRGARFVMSSETEEGQRLSESKLKRITQGMGLIKATRKYENPIQFYESHKLWIDANHLPVIRGTDNAIWNRLHPVPFTITIPKHEQDPELSAKLAGEAAGILAWAVEGARLWYQTRLARPVEIQRAGEKWRADSDQIRRFIDERCLEHEGAWARARLLYTAYQNWSNSNGERFMREADFSNRLFELKFSKDKQKTGMIWVGIGLLAEDEKAPACGLCRGHHYGPCEFQKVN